MTREPGKDRGVTGRQKRRQEGDRGTSSPGRREVLHGVAEGGSKMPRRPTGSIASDVCDGILSWVVARQTCCGSGRGRGSSPSEQSRHGRMWWESRGSVSQALRTGRDEAVMIHALGFALVGILGRR